MDKLNHKLAKIEKKLGSEEVCPDNVGDKLGWHLDKIESLIGGSGGTSDYNDLENKPSIAGVTLTGDKSLEDLGIQADAPTSSSIAPEYDNTATYEVGDLVTYNGQLYQCNTQITVAEEWNSEHWTVGSISEFILGMINEEY